MANKTYQSIKHFGLRASVAAVASCVMIVGGLQQAHAAGLGRLVVFSALGQPLRAEIEVTATREELADMRAQLASPETFKQAGLDYATTLLSIQFNLEKRPNGQAVIKLTSDRPINDPFVDMLMELNWPSGRLVREYTFLLDPPEYAAKASASVAPAVVSAPAAKSGASAIDSDIRARATAQVRGQQPATPKPAEPQPRAGESREVRRGETLHRIASQTKPEGVSLEQMLVGLFRANPEAFDGGNMNRLRAGAIVSIPEKSAIESVSPAEARKVVLAQSSDWNAYRSKLAGAAARSAAKDEMAGQEAAGKITAKVDDKSEDVQPKDQLKVSRTEQAGKSAAGARGASEEDLIAKDRALKEANERNAALEKTVADLQKLLALQDPKMAELEKQASAKPEVAAPPPLPADPVKPVEPPAAAQPSAPPVPVPEAAAPTAPTPPAATQPSEPPVPPPAAKPEEPQPAAKPKVAAPPPPPPEEPGYFDDLLANPMALAGGGGILALLAAYLVVRRRRAAAEVPEQDLSSTLTPPSTTSLSANSVFRSTGGQSVDTASQTPAQTDFSQAGPGSIDTDEVDPVAEADVYMAYGRDAQAEEILLEARQKDPKRLAITLKLLEIYSGRKDIKRFESLATDLYGETSGVGPDWEKAAVMGRVLDPENPLYRGAASSTTAAPVAAAAVAAGGAIGLGEKAADEDPQASASVAAVDEVSDLTSLDFDLGETENQPPAAQEPIEVSSQETTEPEALDFDLGGVEPAGAAQPHEPASAFSPPEISFPEEARPAVAEEPAVRIEVPELDFDIGTKIAPVMEQVAEKEAPAPLRGLDFDLGAVDSAAAGKVEPAVGPEASVNEPATGSDGVEFDVSLTESTFLGRSATEPPSFDISSIDLDLQSPGLETPARQSSPAAAHQERMAEDLSFEEVQVSTAVNADFAVDQMETQVTPSGFDATQGATAVNPDFALDQMETLVVPGASAPSSDAAVPGIDADPAAELDISASEEVATKLDLAKAYEEMGDLEGARELLQEVLKEGDATQRESAQTLLAKIGG